MGKEKKPEGIDYRLLITPRFDERRQMDTMSFLLETTRSFATFQYELSVKETVTPSFMKFEILGLKAPRLDLPSSGHAHFERVYDKLKGAYELTIKGIDGRVNTFSIKIGSKGAAIVKTPPNPFVDIVVDSNLW